MTVRASPPRLRLCSPSEAVRRFDEGTHAVGAAGVASYLSALTATGGLARYAGGERGADALPLLLAQLRERALGARSPAAPGEKVERPLHVLMVDPRAARPWPLRLATELASSLMFLLLLSVTWAAGGAALRRAVAPSGGAAAGLSAPSSGGLGGLGGGGPSFAPKEYVKAELPEKSVKMFADVLGCDEAKAELSEVVQYLRNPERFTRLGGKLPKGILLTGPPGTGKTLLARAVAGEAGVPFFYRAGSEFEEMFVGVGSRRVRALFAAAKKKAPCIVFIDEIDAVGGSRKAWEANSRKTLNQLLVEMDGFESNEGVIVLAATNLAETLDPALTRPGRFDRVVHVPVPDVGGRRAILAHYLSDKPLAGDVDCGAVARGTSGFSGAELANLVNVAAIRAAMLGEERINAALLDWARDRVLMGNERKSAQLSLDCRRLTAYHEGGHALVALRTPAAMPLHKATIMPRGSSLGMVQQLPDKDETSVSLRQMRARLDVCMGGRVAEELIFGEDAVTSGARSDLQQATQLARHMVTECGMSELLGPVYLADSDSGRFKPSADTERTVDEEVRRLLKESYERVRQLLGGAQRELHALAEALLEQETLTADQVRAVLAASKEATPPHAQAGGAEVSPLAQTSAATAAALPASPPPR